MQVLTDPEAWRSRTNLVPTTHDSNKREIMPAMNVSMNASRSGRFGRRLALTGSAVAMMALTGPLTGCLASTQQEVQMGADYAAQINRQLPLVDDPEVNRYINLIGDSI